MGVLRQNAYVKDLNSYPSENVCEISLFICHSMYVCMCLNYLTYKNISLNFAFRNIESNMIYNAYLNVLPSKHLISILGGMGGRGRGSEALFYCLGKVSKTSRAGVPLF